MEADNPTNTKSTDCLIIQTYPSNKPYHTNLAALKVNETGVVVPEASRAKSYNKDPLAPLDYSIYIRRYTAWVGVSQYTILFFIFTSENIFMFLSLFL